MHYKSIKKYTKPQILVPISFTNKNNHQEETDVESGVDNTYYHTNISR